MSDASAAARLPLAASDEEKTEGKPFTLASLERLLGVQQELTAVERFAKIHDAGEHDAQAPYYRALLPANPPGEGEQYAFEVDLDSCTGCKACVTACHNLNGLDEGETFRSVGLLHGGTALQPLVQTVTTACHHCLDPACMKGCPVGAYEKDPITGIVRHLDDQCIGCQYCVFTCPYEVPKFNTRLGIVRKCDMCSERLGVGEAPACVQGCPNQAISIRVVKREQVVEDAQADLFLPGAPSPGITIPSTTYRSKKPMPRNALPADFYADRTAHNHMPLVWLLVLTQLSAGAFCVEQILARLAPSAHTPLHAVVALALGLLALSASILHLGRPLYAFRAILGIRTSWMSREIAAFGGFAGLATAYAGLVAASEGWLARVIGDVPAWAPASVPALGVVVGLAGLFGVLCSVMLYAVTGRLWWAVPRTSFRFFGTAAVLGTATSLVATIASVLFVSGGALEGEVGEVVRGLGLALVALTVLKLAGDASVFLHLRDAQRGDLRRTAQLLSGRLHRSTYFRYFTSAIGGVVIPLLTIVPASDPASNGPFVGSILALLLCVAGEAIERTSFFTAMSAPRMPGAHV